MSEPPKPASMFLTPEELKAMTEATKRPLQEGWLKSHRIPYTKGRKGGINVLRAYVEQAHGLKTEVKEEPELDMDAFKRMHDRNPKSSRSGRS